jgi:hypothetical protein
MLTTAELDAMRATVTRELLDTGTLTRLTTATTTDDDGNVLRSGATTRTVRLWLTHAPTVGTDGRTIAGQHGQNEEPVALFTAAEDVLAGDLLDVGTVRYRGTATAPDRLYLSAELERTEA